MTIWPHSREFETGLRCRLSFESRNLSGIAVSLLEAHCNTIVSCVRADPKFVLSHLHGAYAKGNLRILVGAGISIGSGLPGWDRLNEDVLAESLTTAVPSGSTDESIEFAGEEDLARVRPWAREVYERVGREAAADLAEARLGRTRFLVTVARCLYGARQLEDVPIRSVQRQLAALAWQRPDVPLLHTTNYDLLLERALALGAHELDARPPDWRGFRRPVASDDSESKPTVTHLHGWLEPTGAAGGTVVVTQQDYLKLIVQRDAAPNALLDTLLDHRGPLLILGMSLADPNLRRLLFERHRRLRDASNKIFAVMVQSEATESDSFLATYWSNGWDLQLLRIEDHDRTPSLLRDLSWGVGDKPGWFDHSLVWVDRYRRHASAERAQEAERALKTAEDYIRTYFAIPFEEQLRISLFLPSRGATPDCGVLRKVAGSVPSRGGSLRDLRIQRGRSQGVAGNAFELGLSLEEFDGAGYVNWGFTEDMVRSWDTQYGARSWRSIMAVPILDTPSWIPVAVVTLTSNYVEPCWKRFGSRTGIELPRLKRVLRRASKMYLEHLLDESRGTDTTLAGAATEE